MAHKAKQRKKSTYILITFSVVLLILGISGYFYFNQSPPQVVTGLPDFDENITQLNNGELLKKMQEEVDKDNVRIVLKHEIELNKEGKAHVDVRNVGVNSYNIQVEYYLASNQKKLYVSGLIPPNNGIESVAFKNMPSSGTHGIKIYYKVYDEKELMNTTTIDRTLRID